MLDGKRIAILVEEGFGDLELIEPLRAMKAAEARVVLIGSDHVQNYRSQSGKRIITAEVTTNKVKAEDFDAIIIPGIHSLDGMRSHSSVIQLVKKMHGLNRVIAAICYGPKLLISADIVRGRRLTSSLSLTEDLKNAGAEWVDEPVVQDGNIITARKAADLPVFDWTIIEALRTNR
ncbi:MAG: type 1 glutamine amidotransferase [Dehalococcoidales bacterium]|nr:type 1 glutamine amidotransferase [Dehalococcoidales bacterium]